MLRLLERALRRAQIPVSMTQGFNPRLKLSFPLALQLGVEGLEEIMELELNEWIKPSEFKERFDSQLPEGLELGLPEIIQRNDKKRVVSVVYIVILEHSTIPESDEINKLLSNDVLHITRSKKLERKTFDIRPSISTIERIESGLILHINIMERGTAKPGEILNALGVEAGAGHESVKIVRTNVNLE